MKGKPVRVYVVVGSNSHGLFVEAFWNEDNAKKAIQTMIDKDESVQRIAKEIGFFPLQVDDYLSGDCDLDGNAEAYYIIQPIDVAD